MSGTASAQERRPRLLLVDDQPTNIQVLHEALKDAYEVVFARSGEQALQLVAREPAPDLILLDVVMPGLSGHEVCRRLKADERARDIPVIFVTAMSDDEDEEHGLALGAVDYISRPFSVPIVRARLRTHLALRAHLAELKALNQELRGLNELKNRFLGMAAHDLRNPLTVVGGMADLVQKHVAPAGEKHLAYIRTAAEQMLTLVNDLLDVSVIESGGFELQATPGDLGSLLRERADLASFISLRKDIDIVLDTEPLPAVAFDPNRLAQAVDNLLSNAVKFSAPGSSVRLVGRAQGAGATIAVCDQGPGIPPHECQKLFGTFQRLSVRPTAGEKSTGLGLAIVKKVVEAHGGSVQVDSRLGEGSTFTIVLP